MPGVHSILRACLAAGVAVAISSPPDAAVSAQEAGRSPLRLRATAHPPIPNDASTAWLVPDPGTAVPAVVRDFARGVQRFEDGSYGEALVLVSDARLASTSLADYGTYYTALSYLRLSRAGEARTLLQGLREKRVHGALAALAALAEGAAAEATGDLAGAMVIYDALSNEASSVRDVALDRLAKAATAAGDPVKADIAMLRLYYDEPFSPLVTNIEAHVLGLRNAATGDVRRQYFERDRDRAEKLFQARQYADARDRFAELRPLASGDDAELADLRVAECDYFLGQHRQALDRLGPYTSRASRKAEARFFYLSSLRGLGSTGEFSSQVQQLVTDFPDSSWSEDALNSLATHYIVVDDEPSAAGVFQQIVDRYPKSRHFERAAWKLGWWEYRRGGFERAASVFEYASVERPRADWRPAWLYWAGRARERLNQTALAAERYALALRDYRNSYYGRLAAERVEQTGRAGAPAASLAADAAPDVQILESAVPAPLPGSPPPTADVIRTLLSAGLYGLALAETHHAQRVFGDTALLQATVAWTYQQQGDLRRGITAMRRAYPQFLADGGESLPDPIEKVIFPLDYWDLIHRYARQRELDPYLVAALIAQESTFQAEVRSPANAWGLMQILPSTGRSLARAEGIKRFKTSMLTNPETNVRLGTKYFATLVREFGGVHFALASYNAGASRVERWKAERGDLPRDEFIDDIPFPETQNYVKRIIGTAEDYRRIYGGLSRASSDGSSPAPASGTLITTGRTGIARLSSPSKTTASKSSVKSSSSKSAKSAKKATAKKATAKKAPAKKATAKKPAAKPKSQPR